MDTEKYQANLRLRIIATVIDYGILVVVISMYVVKFGNPIGEGAYEVTGLMTLIPMLYWSLYFPFCEWKFDATLGHRLMKLKVVSVDGGSLSLSQAFKRRIADGIEIIPFFGLPAVLVVNATGKKQRIGDLIAHTLVVKK